MLSVHFGRRSIEASCVSCRRYYHPPMLVLGLSTPKNLQEAYVQVGAAKIMRGNFLNVFIDFIIVALVVYFEVKLLKLDKKKSA